MSVRINYSNFKYIYSEPPVAGQVLGNVMATISDRKVYDGSNFVARVMSAQTYYPFGMMEVGRLCSSELYRYGYQNQEFDSEIKGTGNSINYKYRVHDPRLGRFFSIDPLAAKYPHNSPYAFSENRGIDSRKLEGAESVFANRCWVPYLMHEQGYLSEEDIVIMERNNAIIAMGGLQNLTLATAIFFNPALALQLGLAGGSISGAYTDFIEDGSGYDVLKSTISGFYAGATLAFSPAKFTWANASKFAGVGFMSGFVGDLSGQTFDNMFGKYGGYDLFETFVSGGIGAVANVFTAGLLSKGKQMIKNYVDDMLEYTTSKEYRTIITKTIRLENPRAGTQQIKNLINKRIAENQNLIKESGVLLQGSLEQIIEKATDFLENYVESQSKTQNQ